MSPPALRGERVTLRAARNEDAEALAAIVAEPEVERWVGPHDAARVRADLIDESRSYVVEVDGETAGWLDVVEENDPDYRQAALDIFIATRLHGRGIGPEALRLAIDHLVGRGHHRFTIDPAAANGRAIRAYEKVGFRTVGVMRAYERGADGSWHDNLLMDLLASELAEG